MGKRKEKQPADDKESKEEAERKAQVRKEKTRLKLQAWRKKQKENKEKYDLIKKTDRERKRKERQEIKQKAESDPDFKQKLQKQKREEMQKYREKKRENVVKQAQKKTSVCPKYIIKKKKKDAVRRTQVWRMRLKMKSTISTHFQNDISTSEIDPPCSAESALPREEIPCTPSKDILPFCNDNTITHEDTPAFYTNEPSTSVSQTECQSTSKITKATLYRKLKKIKQILPNTPRRKVAIINKLIESPSTSEVLTQQNKIMTDKCRKRLKVTEDLAKAVSESISEVKTRKSGERKDVYEALCESVSKKISNHAMKKTFNVSLKKTKIKSTWWERNQRKIRSDAINIHIKNSVRSFFLSPEVSREVPNKRETVKVKTDGKKEVMQKHVMVMTLEEAYKEYKSKNPSHKIGLTSFSKLKPLNVKKVSETSRRTCLCQKCCNVALKIEGLTNFKKTLTEKANTTNIQLDKKTLSDMTFCKYEKYPAAKCLRRECGKCGVKGLTDYLGQIVQSQNNNNITWYQWESIEIKKDDKVKRCVSCVPKETDVKTLLKCLEKDMQEYPEHAFRATWQQQQMYKCVEKLVEGSIAMVMDFSENYGCVFQSEVQSGFFDRNQVTIHPMMCYYKEIQEEQEVLVKHAIIGISEETKHDADLALAFENKAIGILEEKGVKIEEIHEWTDGCASQYKGKKAFADISMRKKPKIIRNYFETSHGKNVCDGLGATVKSACFRAVVSNNRVIGCAHDILSYCKEKLENETRDKERNSVSRREFVLVKEAERNREETDVQTVIGTRKLHAVKSVNKDYEIMTRNLSCYCEQCQCENENCNSSEYVQKWETRIISKVKEKKMKPQNETIKAPVRNTKETVLGKRRATTKKDTTCIPVAKKKRSRKDTSQEPELNKYKQGTFVAVGLKPTKGPTCVYMAEVIEELAEECRLKYMKKSGNVYLWPDRDDISQEPKDVILSCVQAPEVVNERGHFRFKTDDLSRVKVALQGKHKHFYMK